MVTPPENLIFPCCKIGCLWPCLIPGAALKCVTSQTQKPTHGLHGAQLASSLRATAYPFVGLLAFFGSRTRLVLAVSGPLGPDELVQALADAAEAHGAEFVADRADASTRVGGIHVNIKSSGSACCDGSRLVHGRQPLMGMCLYKLQLPASELQRRRP